MRGAIAVVVVNSPARTLDKEFHYLIPQKYKEEIDIGKRVFVPFGNGNRKLQASVIDIITESNFDNLKRIISVIDKEPLYNRKMVMLAKWMRRRYLCSYYEAMKVISPPGASIKLKEWIKLRDISDEKIKDVTKCQKEIINILLNTDNNSLELNSLKDIINRKNISPSIKSLIKKGIIRKSYEHISPAKEKIVKKIELTAEYEEIEKYIKSNRKKAPVQTEILNLLLENGSMLGSEILDSTKGSFSTISNLCEKGYVKINEIVSLREVLENVKETKDKPILTDEQKKVVINIITISNKDITRPFLLHGVTGSGKTEVYISLISHYIDKGKKALVLVPEISLTPQIIARFTKCFGNRIAIFHSGLSVNERFDQWKKALTSQVDIVIGARSAVFVPLDNIGIIIIDEEHENTYKSEMSPKYDAREIARFRGLNEKAVVVYSSATPSIESYYKAVNGSFHLMEMKKRYNNLSLPQIRIIDMRKELINENKSIFSHELINEIDKNIKNKQQTILFLNRRAYSSFISCRSCGYVIMCPNCNISLKYHRSNSILKCHYCGYSKKNVDVCPSCNSKYIKYFGIGTQKIEEEVNKMFPQASYLRMDMDTTTKKYSHEKLINRFLQEKIDILIGTQMVSKGHDFKDVTLIGVIAADMSLNIDDFRASERTFQILTQVSGRAGRGKIAGRALIQSYDPDNVILEFAQHNNYTDFYNHEIIIRKELNYPPFCILIMVIIEGLNENKAEEGIYSAYELLQETINNNNADNVFYNILGPSVAPISKIKNTYRWRLIIKCEDSWKTRDIMKMFYDDFISNKNNKNVNLFIDINPINLY